MPATKTDPINRSAKTPGPTKAPRAPANFQSPAPRLRSSTNGNNSSKPKPAPSRESFKPCTPAATVFNATPATNPGKVSQFGMRRLRKSEMPAITESNTAPVRIVVFKPAPNRVLGAGFLIASHVVEKTSSYASSRTCPGRFLALAEPRNALMRGFSHTPVSKSMNRWVRLRGNTLVFNNAGFREMRPLEK